MTTHHEKRARISFLWVAVILFALGFGAYLVVQARSVEATREAMLARAQLANTISTIILGAGFVSAVIGLITERSQRALWWVALFLYIVLPLVTLAWLVFFAAPVAPVRINSP